MKEKGTVTPAKKVAVIVPCHKKPGKDENISLSSLRANLGVYDKFMILPRGLDVEGMDDFRFIRVDPKRLKSVGNYNILFKDPWLYRNFSEYEFILIYHLDSLVFSDQLLQWCEKGYDYIGAACFRKNPLLKNSYCKVQNGGFSLRKVQFCLRVLEKDVGDSFLHKGKDIKAGKLLPVVFFDIAIGVAKKILKKGIFGFSKQYLFDPAYLWWMRLGPGAHQPEDIFWCRHAKNICPDFKIAPMEEALLFSFEYYTEFCYKNNGRKVPFGCHGWNKFDQNFWKSFLKEENGMLVPNIL